ncbi:MAG: hypothetical protein R2774_14925 [Saprospiraceae bacterium]
MGELKNSTFNYNHTRTSNYEYFEKGLTLLKQYPNPEQQIFMQNGMALTYTNAKDYKKSMEYLNKSKIIYDTLEFPSKKRSLGFYYYTYGRNLYNLKDYTKSLEYILKADSIGHQISSDDLLVVTNF